jgi:protein tyrosine/serine phosphatase
MLIREIKLEGAFNVRDLGGLSTDDGRSLTPGLVYRGDALRSLTPEDRRVITEDLGVKTVIDLRTIEEAGGDGLEDARTFPELTVFNFSIVPEGRIGREPFPSNEPEKLAVRYVENLEEGLDAIRDALVEISAAAERGEPVLFHCQAGRDRTGLLSALLLKLVGVADDEVIADYVASNRNAADVTKRLLENPLYANGGDKPDEAPVLLQPETMKAFLALIESRYGGIESWAESAAIPSEVVDSLRETLTPRS